MIKESARVLLIEDNPGDARLIREMLTESQGWNFCIEWAEKITEALDHLDTNTFDIVLADLALPDSWGIDTFKTINTHSPTLPIIVLTGFDQTETAREAMRAGAQDYLVKGQVDGNALRRAIHYAIERKQITEELKANADTLQTRNHELAQARAQLLGMNQSLEDKVRHRTAEVEKLLKQKDQFINQLGHDLKTPLTPLVALLPAVHQGLLEPKLKQMLAIAIDNVDYMKNLVENTLELAQLNAPATKFALVETDLLDETQNIMENLRHALDDTEVTVVNNIAPGISIRVDRMRLREVFDNLVTNAAKFTDAGGTIILSAEHQDGHIVISVTDSGIGLSPENTERIFDEFYKADRSRHDRSSSGLGLSICKSIVEKHGGKIWAKSPGKGRGTTISFTLPKHNYKQDKTPQTDAA